MTLFMNRQRTVLALVLAIQAGLVGAIQANTFPKWTAYLLLAGTVLQSFMTSISVRDKEDK